MLKKKLQKQCPYFGEKKRLEGQTCDDVSLMWLNQLEPHGKEGRGLEDSSLKLLQSDGHIQELPFLLIGEVGIDELLRVREEIEIIKPWRQQMETADWLETELAAGLHST